MYRDDIQMMSKEEEKVQKDYEAKGEINWKLKRKSDKICEHGVYRSRCPHHRNIYVLGLSEETYQFMLNLKAKYRIKYGAVTWKEFFDKLILGLAGKDFI